MTFPLYNAYDECGNTTNGFVYTWSRAICTHQLTMIYNHLASNFNALFSEFPDYNAIADNLMNVEFPIDSFYTVPETAEGIIGSSSAGKMYLNYEFEDPNAGFLQSILQNNKETNSPVRNANQPDCRNDHALVSQSPKAISTSTAKQVLSTPKPKPSKFQPAAVPSGFNFYHNCFTPPPQKHDLRRNQVKQIQLPKRTRTQCHNQLPIHQSNNRLNRIQRPNPVKERPLKKTTLKTYNYNTFLKNVASSRIRELKFSEKIDGLFVLADKIHTRERRE